MDAKAETETTAAVADEPTAGGRRERKATTFFQVADAPVKRSATSSAGGGEGIALKENEFFCEMLNKHKGDDELLKCLHHLMYSTPGKKIEVKKNLKAFNGFPAGTNLSEKISKVASKKTWTSTMLKAALGLFGLERSGEKEVLVARLVNYVANPTATKEASAAATTTGKRKRAKKDSKTTDKSKKPRSMSAFMLYSIENRAGIKAANPTAAFGDIARLVGEKWNSMSDKEKEPWTTKAAKLKEEMQDSEHIAEFDDSDDDASADEVEAEEGAAEGKNGADKGDAKADAEDDYDDTFDDK